MKKAVAYMRCASNDQFNSSIEHQRMAIEQYCSLHDILIVKEYVDVGFSGNNDKRPSFQELMRDAQYHPVWNTILVFDLSRFSRSILDILSGTTLLSNNNIELLSVLEESDTTNNPLAVVQKINLAS